MWCYYAGIMQVLWRYYAGEGFSGKLAGKESTFNAGEPGLIPGSGRSSGKGIGYPLQYSGLENPMDYYSLWGHKELDTTEWLALA